MAHPDLDELHNFLLPFAQEMLAKYGEFYPFGASMGVNGAISAEAAYDGSEHPPSQHMIDLITQGFYEKAMNGVIRAAGICYDVRTLPPGEVKKSDAICISLEHRSGDAVDILVPYKKKWLRKVVYGELFREHRAPQFFMTEVST